LAEEGIDLARMRRFELQQHTSVQPAVNVDATQVALLLFRRDDHVRGTVAVRISSPGHRHAEMAAALFVG